MSLLFVSPLINGILGTIAFAIALSGRFMFTDDTIAEHYILSANGLISLLLLYTVLPSLFYRRLGHFYENAGEEKRGQIDKSFILNMVDNAEDKAIVRATIELAHNLSIDVVAEGVENEETLRRLSGMDCEQAQGYFISKPISGEALANWFDAYEPARYDERRKRSRAFADSA